MARLKNYIPEERDYERHVHVVTVEVKGQYFAVVGDKGKSARGYRVKVDVPLGFTLSDIKRLTPRVLQENEDKYGDFVGLRTFEVIGQPAPKNETAKLGDFFTASEKERHTRLRIARQKWLDVERSKHQQVYGSLDKFDEMTGIPKFEGFAEPDDEDEEQQDAGYAPVIVGAGVPLSDVTVAPRRKNQGGSRTSKRRKA